MRLNIYLILFFIESLTLFAQPFELNVKNLTISEGLSNNTVDMAVQDSLGFIWVKTEVGLCRFDGYYFKNYFNIPDDSTSLQSSFINYLFVDRNNNLWVTTYSGVCRYCREKDNFIRYDFIGDNSAYFSTDFILPNGIERDGFLYGENGIFIYNHKKKLFEKFNATALDSLLKNKDIVMISFDSQNGLIWFYNKDNLYNYNIYSQKLEPVFSIREKSFNVSVIPFWKTIISVESNIYFYDNKNDIITEFNIESANPGNKRNAYRFLKDSKKRLWAWSGNGMFMVEKGKVYHYEKNSPSPELRISDNRISQIFEDSRGNIHLITENGYNILFCNDSMFRQIDRNTDCNKKLTGNIFQKISEISTGELILSSRYSGCNLITIKRNTVKKYFPQNDKNSLAQAAIYEILEDKEKNLWIATQDSGICKFERKTGKWTNIKAKKLVAAELIDNKGNLWLGFRDGGVKKYDIKKKKLIDMQGDFHGLNLGITYVRSFFQLNDDTLLVGTRGKGLFLFDLRTEKFIKRILFFENGKPFKIDRREIYANQILKIKRVEGDIFFIGTDNGLLKFDVKNEKVLEHYVKDNTFNGLAGNSVFAILTDSYGQLWIGTYDGGLSLFLGKEKGFKNFGKDTEVKFNSVQDIIEDKNRMLWFITTNGIMKMNPLTYEIKRYTKKDGFLGNEFNTDALILLSSGEIAAGGVDGLNIFYPDSLTENTKIPKMAFTKFLINNDEVKLIPDITIRKELEVDYKNKVITFEFAAFNFTNTEDNQYKYMLVGANDSWIDLGTKHSVTFTNLEPKKYVLRVIGSNNNGYWNRKGISLKLSIVPPFYMTNWFYLLIFVMVISLIWIMARMRIARYKMVDVTRSRIAENLHDEFGGKLSSIGFMSDLLRNKEEVKNNTEINEVIGKISDQSHAIADDFRDIVWSLNPENDDWESLMIKFRRFASDIFDAGNVNYKIEIPDSFPAKELDSEKKLNYLLLLKEITNNILKHSKADKVSIKISFEKNKIITVIIDNGVGFNPKERSKGNGIINITKRLKILKAKYELFTEEGKGTAWEIIFKF